MYVLDALFYVLRIYFWICIFVYTLVLLVAGLDYLGAVLKHGLKGRVTERHDRKE